MHTLSSATVTLDRNAALSGSGAAVPLHRDCCTIGPENRPWLRFEPTLNGTLQVMRCMVALIRVVPVTAAESFEADRTCANADRAKPRTASTHTFRSRTQLEAITVW